MESNQVNRRAFLQTSSVAAASATTVASLASAPVSARAASSSERIRIGFIGPGGRGFGAHVKSLSKLHGDGEKIDLVAAADVYSVHRDRAADYIKENTGYAAKTYVDYRDMIQNEKLDAVCIATPDHWHHKQVVESLNEGLHVYCEKPMTKHAEEAIDIVRAWQKAGKVMQVGVQSTSLPVWTKIREMLQAGKIGKVLQYQTEFFRNSSMGQWRYYKLNANMTPKTIDWKRWLGVQEGLAPELPFDRAVYAQWRRFWPFGSGMYTDLFVHRTTSMLKATGLRFPGRVVGAGGIFLEYDGRDVPDVATVVADFNEGVQGLVTASMCCEDTPIKQLIRGHHGSFVLGNGEGFDGFDFIPERPQVTGIGSLKRGSVYRIESDQVKDTTYAHFKNWLDAIRANEPGQCNNPPDLGAAAIVTVILGARSYREGKAFFFDTDEMKITEADSTWAAKWEAMSKARQKPNHIAGWNAGDTGSLLEEPDYMRLAGPWIDGKPPTRNAAAGS